MMLDGGWILEASVHPTDSRSSKPLIFSNSFLFDSPTMASSDDDNDAAVMAWAAPKLRQKRQRPQTRVRDCSFLYTLPTTLACADHCVPCAYKIANFDVALDRELTTQVPNQRPEQCPRSKATRMPADAVRFVGGNRILTVGDGDFSYSLALARACPDSTILATSYETEERLLQVYPELKDTLQELASLGVDVRYEVDATQLVAIDGPFDRIVWNFPCTAIEDGQDGQNQAMEDNKELVRKFMVGAAKLLSDKGQVHMNHKTKPPYDQWAIEKVALEKCGEDESMVYLGRVVLDRCALPPYVPRKALQKQSFPHHDACTYVFGKQENDDWSEDLIAVTPELIASLRESIVLLEQKKSVDKKPKKKRRHY